MTSADFKVELDPPAARELKKLHRQQHLIASKIIKLINLLPSHPFQGKALKGNKKGCYSLRQGDYRIIYEVYTYQKVIHIIRIGHRKDIYR